MSVTLADAAVALLGLVGCFLFLGIGYAGVMLLNYAIGRSFQIQADVLKARLKREACLFREDEVRLRVTASLLPLAASVRWLHCDLRVLSNAVYVFQYQRWFGIRFGQPLIVCVRAREHAPSEWWSAVLLVRGPASRDGHDVFLEGVPSKGFGRMRLRLRAKDAALLEQALISAIPPSLVEAGASAHT